MRLQLILILTSLLSTLSLPTLEQPNFRCEFNKSLHSDYQGLYTVYDVNNGILHLASFVGEPTFLIYRTNLGAKSLNFSWTNPKNGISDVSLSSFELLYGFVARSIIEFNVSSASVHFDLEEYSRSNSSSFKTTPLSNLHYNLTSNTECGRTGKIHVSLMQKNNSSNATQFDLIIDLRAFSQPGRLYDQPRYSFRGNNSVIDFSINNFQYNLTDRTAPASRLAIELDFLRYRGEQLIYSSHANIDDEYTPAVFLQNTINNQFQEKYFYWKPIAYVARTRTVENSMMVTFLNGTLSNTTVQQNTTGFYYSLQKNVNVSLERVFFLFGTEGDSALNPNYVLFRAEIGIGTPPTDSISLPLLVAIGIGFGLPVLGLAMGFVGMFCFMAYKCCFRKSTRNARYVSIN